MRAGPTGRGRSRYRNNDRVDLEEVAAELYRLPPGEFTAVRDRRAKEARAAGSRDLAEQIKQLRRPTAAAWLANLLVREQREQVEQLLELGAALRAAQETLSGEALLALSRQRQLVVGALGREARRLAAATGAAVPADAGVGLEDTLRAALADDRAAQLLRAGRLTTALHPDAGGFDLAALPAPPQPAAGTAAPAPAPPGRTPPAPTAAQRSRERERERQARQQAAAQEAVRRAEREVEEADAAASAAGEVVQQQRADLADLQRRIAELQAESDRVRAEESLSQRELRRLQARLEAADQAAQQAAQHLAAAQAARDRLPR